MDPSGTTLNILFNLLNIHIKSKLVGEVFKARKFKLLVYHWEFMRGLRRGENKI